MTVKIPFNAFLFSYRPRCRPRYIVCAAIIVLIVIAVLVAYFLGAFTKQTTVEELYPPNPVRLPKPSPSTLHTFKKAAVCADGPPCAEIGK